MRTGAGSAIAVVITLIAGCAGGGAPQPDPVELTVFAAASLATALDEVRSVYEAANPGLTLTLSSGSSTALRAQIEQGAPADVFLSADTENPRALVGAGLADGTAVAFAANRLTVIVPTANPAGIRSPADLGRAGVKVAAAGEEVPITRYTDEVVRNLARLPAYPTNFAAAYATNIVSREDNVSAVVAKVRLGEADAAIVYVTDAVATDEVNRVPIPDEANAAATYAGVVVKASPRADRGHAFLGWLAGSEGRAILVKLGFLPPPAT